MLRSGSLLLAAVALASPLAAGTQTGVPSPQERADEFFARGVALHQAGDILGAIEAYQDALKLDPDRIEPRSNLGAAFVRLGRYEDAIEQYRKGLALDMDSVTVRFNLALALYKGARIPEAEEEFRRVVEREPGNRNATLLLADCRLQMGQDRSVIEMLSPLEVALGDDRLFAYLLGTALVRENELQRGQVLIDRLFKGGDSAEAHLLLGAQHLRHEDHRSAIEELKRAVELNPKLPTVQALYGRALIGTGDREGAAAAFRRELEANPTDFDSNLYLGLLRKDENRLEESQDYLNRAARMRPRDASVLYALGGLHLAAGRVEAAQQVLESLVKEVPEYQQGHVLLATVYYRQKRKDLGDRERAIVERLKAEAQAREPGTREDLGPAYRGEPAATSGKRKPERPGEKTPR